MYLAYAYYDLAYAYYDLAYAYCDLVHAYFPQKWRTLMKISICQIQAYYIPTHSSLLSVFGLNATSTYDSYLPLIFGKFALIWGHFQNILTSRFWGRWGRRGQTTSKSKMMKILNENLLKLDEIQILASATSKMTSWPQRPRKWLSGFFQKIHF